MAQKKSSRKGKKYRPQTRNIGLPLLHRLTVPESTIQTLKSRHDAILLRMYLGTDSHKDRCELFTVLHLGQVLAKFTDDPETINQGIDEGIRLLDNPPEPGENGERNLDLLKDALELCENVWRLVTVEEFVLEAKKLKEM